MDFDLKRWTRRAALASAAFTVGLTPSAWAADFSGKTIEIIVPASAGGGTDTWARFWAGEIQPHLPGEPTIVVRNMPGGGHTIGGNWFADNAQPDGLTLLASSGTGHFNYLLGDSRVKYEFQDMTTILASPVGGVLLVAGDLGVSGPDDLPRLKGQPLRYGSQGVTSQDLLTLYMFEQLGLDVEPIMGMRGRSDARLAFERGELNIDYQNMFIYGDYVAPMIEEGKAAAVFTFGMPGEDGTLIRDPAAPDLPHYGEAYEIMHGEPPSGLPFDVYMAFFTAGFGAQKLLSMPAATPEDVIDAWIAAIEAAVADPAFEERKTAVLGPYPQFVGANAEEMKELATNVSPEAKQAVITWLKERFDTDIN